MSDPVTMSYPDFYKMVREIGGITASAWTEGAKIYTAEAERILQQTGQTILTEQQRYDIFVKSQALPFDIASRNAQLYADAARAAGKTGIADVMSRVAQKFAVDAANIAGATIDSRAWLNAEIAKANTAIAAANKTIGEAGGIAGKAFGPIVDGMSMVAGAYEYTQTGDSTAFGQACAGVAMSAAAVALAGLAIAALPFEIPVLAVALVVGTASGVGNWLGEHYFKDVRDWLLDQNVFMDIVDFLADGINAGVNGAWRNVLNPPRRDPLAIDLDGDGIETVGVNAQSPILFDHDGDGVRTGTGWVKGDDAWLVLDRNGDGAIGSGRESYRTIGMRV